MFAAMEALTVQDAARATGWSARMLRYIEQAGLVVPPRSDSGYRLYGDPELERLRTLRDLLARHHVRLDDLGFVVRMRSDHRLQRAVDTWLADAPRPQQPNPIEWLRWDEEKHKRLLQVA